MCDSNGITAKCASLSVKNSYFAGHSGSGILMDLESSNICSVY